MHKYDDAGRDGFKTFPDRLKILVEKYGVRTLARSADLSEGVIRKYVNGESYPTLDRLDKLARAAHVSLSWLASGTQEILSGVEFSPPVEERLHDLGRRISSMVIMANLLITKRNPEYAKHHDVVRYLLSDVAFADFLAEVYGSLDGLNQWDSENKKDQTVLTMVRDKLTHLYMDAEVGCKLPMARWQFVSQDQPES